MFIIFQLFFATLTILKTGEYHLDIPQFWLGHIQSQDTFGAEKFDKARYQDSRQGLSPASGW